MKIISKGTGVDEDFGYVRVDSWNDETTSEIAKHYKAILDLLGEDTSREGLEKTPYRVAKAMQFMAQGYNTDPFVFNVRTSHVTVLRKSTCCLYSE